MLILIQTIDVSRVIVGNSNCGILNFKTPLQAFSVFVYLSMALMLLPKVFGCMAFVHLHRNK